MNGPVSDTTARYVQIMHERSQATREAAWLHVLRASAIARFSATGFPMLQEEDWKYTDVRPIERAAFMPLPPGAGPSSVQTAARFRIDGLSGPRMVFIDGRFSAPLSTLEGLPAGATVMTLVDALESQPLVLEAHLGKYVPEDGHGFIAINTALLADGAFIRFEAGTRLEHPIHVLYLATAGAALLLPRNLIVAERDSQVTVIEHYATVGERHYLTNSLTEIYVGDDAVVEHYRVQEESRAAFHVSGIHAQISRSGKITAHALDFGGRLVRNDLRAVLADSGGECHLNGLHLAADRQHIDNHTYVDHGQPHCTSRQFYRGVLTGRGRTVFRGRIVVRHDAQKSDARQVNNNLLLSREAEADSQPQLEIYADDVMCSHGATVGQLDEDALFYLRTRALSEADARDLLTFAFAREVLDRVHPEPLRERAERLLGAAMRRSASLEVGA